MDSSAKDSSLVATSRQASDCSKSITVWRMPNQQKEDLESDVSSGYSSETMDLQEVATFNQSQKPAIVRSIRWHATEDQLLGVDNKLMTTWDVTSGKQLGVLVVPESDDSAVHKWESGSVCWDPHSVKACAVALGRDLHLVDTREMEPSSQRLRAHEGVIRDVDYNPNKPLSLITAGDDRKVRFWDARNLSVPVKTLAGHSHWVWAARYNPYHDQLVISGGSDNLVNLWRIASCSSSPWISSQDGSPGGDMHDDDPPDVKVRAMDQHEEGVYAVAWSPADAWIYCSLSYDGRAIVNHVPSTEKYKILL